MKREMAILTLVSVALGLALLLTVAGHSRAQAPQPAEQAAGAPDAPASGILPPRRRLPARV